MKLSTKQTDALIQALEGMIDASRKTDHATLTARLELHRQRGEKLLAEIKMPARETTINAEQELYVIPEIHGGYSCLGFDVCLQRHNALAAWLRKEGLQADDLPPEARGGMRAFTAYCRQMSRAASYCQRNNLRCPVELTPQLTGLEGKRVEVVDRYGERRRFQVGKSTGWLPIHLEIARRNSSGGPAVTGAPFRSVRIVA